MAVEGEISIVVDDNDEIIKYKSREQLTYDDMFRMVAIWLENDEGKILIHKRSATKKHGANRWENAAGGGVAKSENYEEAAYKELAEEIGVDDIKLELVGKTIVHTDKGKRMCSWFRGICNRKENEFVLEADNVVAIKWVDKNWLFDDRDKNPDKYMPSSAHWRELFS